MSCTITIVWLPSYSLGWFVNTFCTFFSHRAYRRTDRTHCIALSSRLSTIFIFIFTQCCVYACVYILLVEWWLLTEAKRLLNSVPLVSMQSRFRVYLAEISKARIWISSSTVSDIQTNYVLHVWRPINAFLLKLVQYLVCFMWHARTSWCMHYFLNRIRLVHRLSWNVCYKQGADNSK